MITQRRRLLSIPEMVLTAVSPRAKQFLGTLLDKAPGVKDLLLREEDRVMFTPAIERLFKDHAPSNERFTLFQARFLSGMPSAFLLRVHHPSLTDQYDHAEKLAMLDPGVAIRAEIIARPGVTLSGEESERLRRNAFIYARRSSLLEEINALDEEIALYPDQADIKRVAALRTSLEGDVQRAANWYNHYLDVYKAEQRGTAQVS